ADETAARIHDDVAAIVAAPGGDEWPGLALGAEAELLVGDQLGDGEAVVYLRDVDVLGRHAGRSVGRLRGSLHRGPVGIGFVQRRELEPVERLTTAANPDGPVRQRARPLLARDDYRGGAVGDR